MIWFGTNETVVDQLAANQSRFWHLFQALDNGWYKMRHQFGSHMVQITRTPDNVNYHIYEKSCGPDNEELPIGELVGQYKLICHVVDNSDYSEFTWKFIERTNHRTTIVDYIFNCDQKYYLLIVIALVVVIILNILADKEVNQKYPR
ncbi:uncharacterized protein LOC128960465 [Oppia nitens]|uniref:uncharacterized protein LOC128960465 n=1 Tax=Oppia nitens TaxID=1686743 RepID=UPI0023DAB8A8|nr:uncharacterized protein LOC128960465 [Oppia nitens]